MVVLVKVKASTLMETLVATVLIVVIFIAASMILNTVFSNSIKNNTRDIATHLNELQYLEDNNKLQLPYQEEFGEWQISIMVYKENNKSIIEFEASNQAINNTIIIEQNRAE